MGSYSTTVMTTFQNSYKNFEARTFYSLRNWALQIILIINNNNNNNNDDDDDDDDDKNQGLKVEIVGRPTFFISTFFILHYQLPWNCLNLKITLKVENLIETKWKYNPPYQITSCFSVTYHSFFHNTISRKEIRGRRATMLFCKSSHRRRSSKKRCSYI